MFCPLVRVNPDRNPGFGSHVPWISTGTVLELLLIALFVGDVAFTFHTGGERCTPVLRAWVLSLSERPENTGLVGTLAGLHHSKEYLLPSREVRFVGEGW